MMHLKSLAQWKFLVTVTIAATLLTGCGDRNSHNVALEVIDVMSPAAPGSQSPHLAVTPAGEAVMSWLEPTGTDNPVSFFYRRKQLFMRLGFFLLRSDEQEIKNRKHKNKWQDSGEIKPT